MIDIKKYTYDKVLSKIGTEVQVDKEALYHGICFYIDDHNLEEIFNGNRAQKVIDMYLEPILEMPNQQLYDFFISQKIMRDFQQVSAAILSLANQKYNGQPFSLNNLDELEQALSQRVNAFINSGKLELIESEVSECYVDLAYLKDESSNISIRLMRRNRV